MIRYAAQAIARGFHVFQVEPGQKTPHTTTPGKPYVIRWSEYATRDMAQVYTWYKWSPTANVGIACKPSKLLVVDIDGGEEGCDQYDAKCAQIGLPQLTAWDTYTVRTGRGGYHLYFWWPPEIQASQAGITPLVDIRSNGGRLGGYVLGAGSATEHGTYRVEYPRGVAPCPGPLIELCRDRPPIRPARPPSLAFSPKNHHGLYASVADAQDGNRNNVLLWAARCMAEDGATLADAEELLVRAAMQCGLDGGERQALSTIRSAYRLQGAS